GAAGAAALGSAGLSPAGAAGAAGGGVCAEAVITFCMHLVYSSLTACDFFMSSSLGFAASLSASLAMSWVHLVIDSMTLSAHAFSVHLHIWSRNSDILAIMSLPPFFLQPANDRRESAARIAIERFFIDFSGVTFSIRCKASSPPGRAKQRRELSRLVAAFVVPGRHYNEPWLS